MNVYFDEQDVVDACCVFIAGQHGYQPEDIEVELQHDAVIGFSAAGRSRFRHYSLNEQDMIDAVAYYLREFHRFNPDDLEVELRYEADGGIQADIRIR